VPQNVGVASVQITIADTTHAATVPDFVLAVQKVGAFNIQIWQTALTQGQCIKVTPGTTSIVLTNFSPTDSVAYCVVFGIDG